MQEKNSDLVCITDFLIPQILFGIARFYFSNPAFGRNSCKVEAALTLQEECITQAIDSYARYVSSSPSSDYVYTIMVTDNHASPAICSEILSEHFYTKAYGSA